LESVLLDQSVRDLRQLGEQLGEFVRVEVERVAVDRDRDGGRHVDLVACSGNSAVLADEVRRKYRQHHVALAFELLGQRRLLHFEGSRHPREAAAEIAELIVAQWREIEVSFALRDRAGGSDRWTDRAGQQSGDREADQRRDRDHDQSDDQHLPNEVVDGFPGFTDGYIGDDDPVDSRNVDRCR